MMPPQDFDYDLVDERTIETTLPTYPSAQWLNGQTALKALGGVAYTGGIVIPRRSLAAERDADVPGFTPTTLTFRSGKDEPALTAMTATVAVLRTRFCWKYGQNGHPLYVPRSGYVANVGMKGRLQVLVVFQGDARPFAITFSAKASQFFENLLKGFDQQVVGAAHKLSPSGQRLPRFAFWLTLTAGKHQKANADYESIITPPTLTLPADITRETLRTWYVGRENLERFTALYHAAEAWAKAWNGGTASPLPADEPGEEETETPF